MTIVLALSIAVGGPGGSALLWVALLADLMDQIALTAGDAGILAEQPAPAARAGVSRRRSQLRARKNSWPRPDRLRPNGLLVAGSLPSFPLRV
jgi:hypothetical protein